MGNSIKAWFRKKAESLCEKLENSILSNKSLKCKVVFGPVRSRRLGYVLGINNIKEKACPYNCVYCPVGKTKCCSVCTNYCLSPYELNISVRKKIEALEKSNKKIDYIVFAGSGEPTLDSGLSQEILLLREFGYKIAVFTNSSLLWNNSVQENLMFADYVSLKIDTVNEETWLKINRPHKRLDYSIILNGIKQFSKKFNGTLTTETTLVKNINDNSGEIKKLSEYFKRIKINASYFTTPMYPPSESFAVSPDEATLQHLSQTIKETIPNSVLLCCSKTEEFFVTDDFENELLGWLALHPVNKNSVKKFINSYGGVQKLNSMIDNGIIKEMNFNGEIFLAENRIN